MADILWLDEIGEDKAAFTKVDLTSLKDRVQALGMQYAQMLADSLDKTEASSSGDLGDSIKALSVEVSGNVYSVDVEALKYASYIDEGVDGWAKSRGSRFKFKQRPKSKNKGGFKDSPMVKSIKEYLIRENKLNQSKYAVMNKKGKPKSDIATREASRVAYMIKRFGIKPTHFWRRATAEMEAILAEEFGQAIKITIIENLK